MQPGLVVFYSRSFGSEFVDAVKGFGQLEI